MLFTLAWIAERFDTSALLAGFAAGVMVSLLGEPRRVADQLIGLGEGFFVPLFFVVLGARHRPARARALARRPVLFALLAVATTLVPRRRRRDRAAAALERAARGGGDGRAVGRRRRSVSRPNALRPGQAAAIVGAAAVSLAVASVGAVRLGAEPVGQSTRTGRRGVNTNVAPPLIFASAISGASVAGGAAGSITAS